MNLFKREWQSYLKPTLLWSIGLILLVVVAFYKVDGMSGMEGGMNAMMEALPGPLQAMFGMGNDYTTGIGIYSLIHLYVLIALSFHAAFLGSSIFTKEERDRTYEFLYIKGMRRNHILCIKTLAGISILLCLNVVCYSSTLISLSIANKAILLQDIFPFILGVGIAQVFFFSSALLLSFLLPNNQKAGSIICYIILVMFLITMYAKLGGNVSLLNKFSIFYYMDASRLLHGIDTIPCIVITFLSALCFIISLNRHDKRDLL